MPITRAYAQAAEPGNFFVAGKNKIINGDFGIWQRGTSSTSNGFLADRFNLNTDIASFTQSRQAFTPGTAPVAGYEGKFFYRFALTTLGAGTYWYLNHFIEDVQTLAGQTITFSFWAKADSTRSVSLGLNQNFGSGGSSTVGTDLGTKTLSTSWTRYTCTVSLPSISGKTVGTSSYIQPYFAIAPSAGMTIDIWGVQLEAGAVATPFTTATGTLAGELALAQRYFVRFGDATKYLSMAYARSTTAAFSLLPFPVQMRIAPTLTSASGTNFFRFLIGSGDFDCNSISLDSASDKAAMVRNTSLSGMTIGQGGALYILNASAYLEFSAEL